MPSEITDEMINRADSLLSHRGHRVPDNTIRMVLEAALSVSPAIGEGSRVEVKPLEWRDTGADPRWLIGDEPVLSSVYTIAGRYTIIPYHRSASIPLEAQRYAVRRQFFSSDGPGSNYIFGQFGTIEQAKTAAQADYDRLIRSALRFPPEPVEGDGKDKIAGMIRKLDALRIAFNMKGANATTILRVINTLSSMQRIERRDAPEPVEITNELVRYIARYGGSCRDCADEDGVCPTSGLPCGEAERAIRHVLKALNYGVSNGYLPASPISTAATPEPVAWVRPQTLEWYRVKSGAKADVSSIDMAIVPFGEYTAPLYASPPELVRRAEEGGVE